MVISADEWLKQQGVQTTQTRGGGSSGIISADEFLKTKQVVPSPKTKSKTKPKQQPKKTQDWFTKQDPKLILDTLKDFALGVLPGSREAIRQIQTGEGSPLSPKAKWDTPLKIPYEGVKDVLGIAKGIAGIPFRLGLGVSDLLGGPKQLNVPVIGEQQSPQETYRQTRAAGGGQVVSTAIPAAQTLMDLLIARGVTKGLGKKPTKVTPEVPKVPEQKLLPAPKVKPIKLPATIEEARKMIPKPKVEEPFIERLPGKTTVPRPSKIKATKAPSTVPPTVIDTPIKEQGAIRTAWDSLFKNVNEKVAKQGAPGKELANRGKQVVNESSVLRGTKATVIEETMPKLNKNQQLEAIKVLKEGAISSDPVVNKAVNQYRKFTTNYQAEANRNGFLLDDVTGEPVGNPQTYFHHMLNEAGVKALSKKPNTFFSKLAKSLSTPEKPVNTLEARTFWNRYLSSKRTVKAGFEREFKDLIPPEYLETDLTKSLLNYNRQFAHRSAVAKYLGPDYKIAENLASRIGEAGGDEMIARNYIDQLTGRNMKNMPVEKAWTNLIRRQVHTKLGFTSSLPNLNQGYLANVTMYGQKHALAGLLKSFTKEGKQFAKETGAIGEGFYSDFSVTNKAWRRMTGFPLTEDFNFISVTNASKLFIKDMYKKLLKNPNDTLATKKLDSMGINWRESLSKKAPNLPSMEIKKGAVNQAIKSIMPKVAGNTPEWAQSGVGRATYTFWHYSLQNPKFLLSEFEFGKTHGVKRLAATALTAAVLGEPVADILAFFRGDDRPDNVALRAADNITTLVGGAPFEIAKSAIKYGGWGPTSLATLGGPVVSAPLQSGSKVLKDVSQGRPDKATEDILRALLRGDVPVGPEIPSGAVIERLIPRVTK